MAVEGQKLRIIKIQDGGQICTETLRTQMLQSIATGGGLSFLAIGAMLLISSCIPSYRTCCVIITTELTIDADSRKHSHKVHAVPS